MPVYNPIFIDQALKVVRCVCYWCGAFLAKDYTVKNEAKRLAEFSAHCKGKACPECEGVQPKYSKAGFTIRTTWPPKGDDEVRTERMEKAMQEPFTAKRALLMLKHMSEGALEALRFREDAPERTLFSELSVVAGVCAAFRDARKQIGHDELTHKSQDIVKVANQVAAAGAGAFGELLTSNVWALLYKDVNSEEEERGWSGPSRAWPNESLERTADSKEHDGETLQQFGEVRHRAGRQDRRGPGGVADEDRPEPDYSGAVHPFNLFKLKEKVRVGYKRLGRANASFERRGKWSTRSLWTWRRPPTG